MEEPRAPLDSELPEVLSFFDQHLRPGTNWSIAEEYPLVMTSQNLANFRVIKDNGRIVSGAVTKNLLIKNQLGVFKIAGIGSVVTSEEHRNQGLSRTVLNACIQTAKSQGCDFAILWTNLFEFYRKIGFEMAGTEISLIVENELPVKRTNLRILESSKVSAEAILKIYAQHTTGTVRTAEDIRRHLQIPNSRIYTAWDSNNAIQAYAVEGKGADLQDYVHDWAGNVPALLELFSHIRKTTGRPLTVISPGHCENLIRQMQDLGVQKNEGILGMIKILNFDNLLFKIKRYARFIGIDDFVFESRDKNFYIGSRENLFQTDSELDVVKLIFGPLKAGEIHNFDEHTRKNLEAVLPIPMWIWGWDSV